MEKEPPKDAPQSKAKRSYDVFFDAIVLRGWDFGSELLKSLSEDEKGEFVQFLEKFLEEADCQTFESSLKWHVGIRILRNLSENLFKKKFESRMDAEVKKLFAFLERQELMEGSAHERADAYLRQMYRVIAVVYPYGEKYYQEIIAKIENASFDANDKAFIEEKLAAAKEIGPKDQKDLDFMFEMSKEILPKKGGKKFKKFGDEWCFEYREKSGRKTYWSMKVSWSILAQEISLQAKSNPQIAIIVDMKKFMEMVEKDKVDELVEEAYANYKGEEDTEKRRLMESFDLPRDRKTLYVKLFPNKTAGSREIVASALYVSVLLSRVLKRKYGDKLEVGPTLFADDPKQKLFETIRKSYESGVTHFCIQIFTHGDVDGLDFDGKFTAREIAELAEAFPDCTFTYQTNACYGGGLRDSFIAQIKKNPKLAKQVSVFLETKPTSTTISATVLRRSFFDSGSKYPMDNILGTNYQLHFIEALYDGMTYGEAARYADIETKKYMFIDAEAIIDGQLITENKIYGKGEEPV